MEWKSELQELEASKNWRECIKLLEKQIQDNPVEVEPYIRIIYLHHNLLIEEDYKEYGFEHDYLANLLTKYFRESLDKFADNAEYLFFVGNIIHIAEWLFGQDNDELAIQMQKKAMELAPDNLLFEYCYRFSIPHNEKRLKALADKIFEQHKYLDWTQTKGYPGRYAYGKVKAARGLPW